LKWQFLLDILLHLLDLVLNYDGLIDHPLEILIVCVEKLKLDLIVESILIIESIQEGILFLFIGIDIIWHIPWQLSRLVEILIHNHTALLQFREFLLLEFERTAGYIVSSKPSFELIPGDSTNIQVRVVVSLPPILNGSK
jgi:hypothetical protein